MTELLRGAPQQFVLTAGEFERRLISEPSFAQQIAGVSSISLYHLRKGLCSVGYSLPITTTHNDVNGVFVDLNPEVYRVAFDEEPFYGPDLQWMIERNRAYARDGAIIDYVMNQPNPPRHHKAVSGMSAYIGSLVAKAKEIEESELRAGGLRLVGPDPRLANNLSYMFPSEEDAIEALITLRDRGGVQVVLGDKPHLIEFLKAKKATPEDDYAAFIPSSVPSRLVLGVIPMGEYETRALVSQ